MFQNTCTLEYCYISLSETWTCHWMVMPHLCHDQAYVDTQSSSCDAMLAPFVCDEFGGGRSGGCKAFLRWRLKTLPWKSSIRSVRKILLRLATTRFSDTCPGMPKIPGLACQLGHWWRYGVWHVGIDTAEDTWFGMPIQTLSKIGSRIPAWTLMKIITQQKC
jgi:hypothetical protein